MGLKEKIEVLDLKGESEVLSEDEIEELHGFTEELFSLVRINYSMCWQQSRTQWLREGDANSKFFHGVMSNRWRRNSIPFFLVNGVLVEGVGNVRNAVYSHFSTHFQRRLAQRPSMDSLAFCSLSAGEGAALTRPFSVDEVRIAVWDCENYKSPGPDGINFGFIKEFWDTMKEDVMRFLVEFHRNGRLAQGINSTFITLIPKG